MDAKTLEPLLAKRLATLNARHEAVGQKLSDLTGAGSAKDESTLTKTEAEALRREIKELCADYRKLLDFLRGNGSVTAADAEQLKESLAATEQAMTDAVIKAERARIIVLDRLPDLIAAGDGINYTYQARKPGKGTRPRRPSGLDRALRAFGEAGYDVQTDAASGEIAVREPGGRDLVARFTPDLGAVPDAAVKPGQPPRTPKQVTELLRQAGFSESEIISFGGADASKLGTRTAGRVTRLLEKFTMEDLRALARVLWKYDVVLTDRMVDQMLEHIEAGRMEAFLQGREAAADAAAQSGLDASMAEGLGMSVADTNVRKPRADKGQTFDHPWRLAEKHTGAALEAKFGPGWRAGRRFFAPTAEAGQTLGSTIPEYYRKETNTAVEVKRWDLVELGLDPAHPGPRGTPSTSSVEALQRAARQVATRKWALPGEAEGVAPAESWIVFDVRGQGVVDRAGTGASLKALMAEYKITYDRVMLLTEGGLVDVTTASPSPTVAPAK